MCTRGLLLIISFGRYVATFHRSLKLLSLLLQVSGWYTLVIFTASMQEYADPVIDWLDAGRGILAHRLFRDVSFPPNQRIPSAELSRLRPAPQSCTQLPNGSYTKDLSMIEADLSRVCLVDNSPISYRINEGQCEPPLTPPHRSHAS